MSLPPLIDTSDWLLSTETISTLQANCTLLESSIHYLRVKKNGIQKPHNLSEDSPIKGNFSPFFAIAGEVLTSLIDFAIVNTRTLILCNASSTGHIIQDQPCKTINTVIFSRLQESWCLTIQKIGHSHSWIPDGQKHPSMQCSSHTCPRSGFEQVLMQGFPHS